MSWTTAGPHQLKVPHKTTNRTQHMQLKQLDATWGKVPPNKRWCWKMQTFEHHFHIFELPSLTSPGVWWPPFSFCPVHPRSELLLNLPNAYLWFETCTCSIYWILTNCLSHPNSTARLEAEAMEKCSNLFQCPDCLNSIFPFHLNPGSWKLHQFCPWAKLWEFVCYLWQNFATFGVFACTNICEGDRWQWQVTVKGPSLPVPMSGRGEWIDCVPALLLVEPVTVWHGSSGGEQVLQPSSQWWARREGAPWMGGRLDRHQQPSQRPEAF